MIPIGEDALFRRYMRSTHRACEVVDAGDRAGFERWACIRQSLWGELWGDCELETLATLVDSAGCCCDSLHITDGCGM